MPVNIKHYRCSVLLEMVNQMFDIRLRAIIWLLVLLPTHPDWSVRPVCGLSDAGPIDNTADVRMGQSSKPLLAMDRDERFDRPHDSVVQGKQLQMLVGPMVEEAHEVMQKPSARPSAVDRLSARRSRRRSGESDGAAARTGRRADIINKRGV